MTLYIGVLFIFVRDFLLAEEIKTDRTYELWKVENVDNKDVLIYFEARAHVIDEVWQDKNTIYFIVGSHEISQFENLLNDNNVDWVVLAQNLTGNFNDDFINKYKNIGGAPTTLKASTLKTRRQQQYNKNRYTPKRLHYLYSTEEVTEASEPPELWRIEHVTSKEVLTEFNDRAHMTDEIWKRNDTIDFVVGKHEVEYWRNFLRDHGHSIKILEKKITQTVNEDFIKKYINTRRGNRESPKVKAKVNRMKATPSSPAPTSIKESELNEPVAEIESSAEVRLQDVLNYAKYYDASELWRADNVTSTRVLSEFNDRAHMTDEIWKVDDTIYFILDKHETSRWSSLLEEHNINFKVLEKNIKGKFDDKFISKYTKGRLGSK